MKSLFTKIVFPFCVIDLLNNKQKIQYKICYKKKYSFLNLKNSTSQALSNRFMKKGNFLKIYKIVKKFYYIYILRKNFSTIPLMSNFLFFYNKYQSFRDFDRVLLWKYSTLDCMFTSKTRKKKKNKKKKKFNLNLIFITGLKRLLLCINIIKYLILLNLQRRKKNLTYDYLAPLFQYLMTDKNNMVIKVKYKIYKQKLMQLQG